jgi:solute carrier family 50 protein (sugar transporter)
LPSPQDLNPLPFPAIVANCAGWVAYSYITQDVLVLWPNVAGFLLGMFYTLSAYGLADTKTRDRQMAIMLFFSTIMMVVGAVGTLGDFEYHKLKNLWGFTANGEQWLHNMHARGTHVLALLPCLAQPGTHPAPAHASPAPTPPCFPPAAPLPAAILLIFYASPLSTLLEVLRTRCSASLNLPLSVMNVINGSLWLVYGLAISDYFIAVPNGVGAGLGVVYCALILTFPRKSAK